jgi:hypothetical protein
MPHHTLLKRIRAEYLEMPGLRLKLEQAQRLCGIERTTCQRVLDMLVEMKFLCVKPDGAYARLTDGADHPRAHPAKAGLTTEAGSLKASWTPRRLGAQTQRPR